MKVKYLGNSSFELKSKDAKLVTNPFDEGVSKTMSRIKPDIVITTHKSKVKENDYYMITSPGEFEVKDIFVYGFLSFVDKKNEKDHEQADLYMVDVEGIHFGIIDKSVSRVRSWVRNEMGIVDVLFVSLAEDSKMKLDKLGDLVNKIEPFVVIPMDYTKKSLEKFSKMMGVKEMEKEKDMKFKKSDFSDEEAPMRFVLLEK